MIERKSQIVFDRLIRKNVELKQHSNWKIGGPADYFAEPESIEELAAILQYAKKLSIPVQVIGKGTNILFDDDGYRGLIIKIGIRFNQIDIQNNKIVTGAGVWAPCFARYIGAQGFTGFEHIIGIPGSMGGLVVMNGGSQRKSVNTNISRVFVLDYSGKASILKNHECEFSYRHSIFQKKELIIYQIEFQFEKSNPAEIRDEMIEILASRRKKFPLKLPNCGSTFISNSSLHSTHGSPGKIIEDLGLKGYTSGGAMISKQHANFIVNIKNARSADVIAIFNHVRNRIYWTTNYWIKSEIRYLSPDLGITFLDQL